MRDKIVAGNWKMNNDFFQTKLFLDSLKEDSFNNYIRIMVSPSFTNLHQSINQLSGSKIEVIAQNMNASDSGAYTGEISASMLKSIGVSKVILGHSERRAYYNESNQSLALKVQSALRNNMEFIFCFGEELSDRKNGNHFKVVENQISSTLYNIPDENWNKIILAYEPVWAIGTGETATPDQAQEMHLYVRELIKSNYNEIVSRSVPILYGGSVKPDNAKIIFSKPDVDGGLIGGASLVLEDFKAIINAL
jgi:triosephosphate isomerase